MTQQQQTEDPLWLKEMARQKATLVCPSCLKYSEHYGWDQCVMQRVKACKLEVWIVRGLLFIISILIGVLGFLVAKLVIK